MARTDSLTNWMTDIANSIREKTEKTDPIPAANFDTEIAGIKTGDTSLEDGLVMRTLTEYTNDRVTSIGKYNFYESLIKNFDFPNVEMIEQRAFYNAKIESINVPNVTDIGVYSFYNCPNITKIDMPLLTAIGDYCFANCSNLTEINLPKVDEAAKYLADKCTNLTTVNIPLMPTISDYAFNECVSLTEIDLPKVTSIRTHGFTKCTNLEIVRLYKNITTLGTYAFEDCSKLREIDLSKFTTLSDASFRRCVSLETISMPKLSGSISASYVFQNCTAIKSLDLPKITDLYNSSDFAHGCSSLEKVNLPALTGGLGNYCFAGCTSLTKIEFNLITKFKSNVFSGCSNLTTFIIRTTTVPSLYNTSIFNGTPIASGDGYIYVPESLVNSYIHGGNWFLYEDKFIGINEDTSIITGNSFTPTYIGETTITNWDLIILSDNTPAEINSSTGVVTTTEAGNVLIRGLDADGNILHVVYLSIVDSEEV